MQLISRDRVVRHTRIEVACKNVGSRAGLRANLCRIVPSRMANAVQTKEKSKSDRGVARRLAAVVHWLAVTKRRLVRALGSIPEDQGYSKLRCWLCVHGTCVADRDDFIRHSVLAYCRAGVDAVNVVDTAANGVLLDDADTHID